MKKIIAIVLLICILLCVTACANNTEPESLKETDKDTPDVQTELSKVEVEEIAPQEPVEDNFLFYYNGIEIKLNALAEPIVEALGEPKKYTESASCAFDGLDKTYFYGSFYMDTYPMEGIDFVYGWWFADDSVSTQEGIYIGASQAEVESAYGVDSFNGSNAYIVTRDRGTLTVIVENGVVTSIQYAVILD